MFPFSFSFFSCFAEKKDFIFSESKRYPLIDFQLGEEEGSIVIAFKSESVVNYAQFLESLANHPEIEIISLSITPNLEFQQVKAFLQ